VLEGAVPAPGATTLNPNSFQEWCIAVISLDAPPGTPGVAPTLVAEGLGLLPYHDAIADPYQTSTALLTPIAITNVALENNFNAPEDTDSDGKLDVSDNCPYVANPGQENNGDVLDATVGADPDGDACECADANGSGAVFPDTTPDPVNSPGTPDLELIREYLVGLTPAPEIAAIEAICSVSESVACTTKDAVVLQRALAGLPPGVEARCAAALPN